MLSFLGILQLLLVLQQVPAQTSDLQNETSSSRVMPLTEVLEKSLCQPMEQLVDVESEFPEDVESIYIPACVSLRRCAGCCMDEWLECHPTLERNITLQMMRILPHLHQQQVELTFVEHQSCECRLDQKLPNFESSTRSIKNRPRSRKHKKTANGCEKCQLPQTKVNLD